MPHRRVLAVVAPSFVDRAVLLLGALVAAACLSVAAFAAPAVPGAPATKAPAVSKEVEAAWQKHWKNYARRCVKLRDLYFACGTFDPLYPSSKGVTTLALRQKSAREVTETKSNLKIKKYLVRPNEDIDPMARGLPEATIGHYGYIHSAEILDILGPDEMVIAGIWIVSPKQVEADREKESDKLLKAGVEKGDVKEVLDWVFENRDLLLVKQREKTFRQPIKLRGFSTVGLAKGERWTGRSTDKDGVQIAMVGEEEIEPKGTRTRRTIIMPVAIPAELFMKGIAEEKDFLAMLTARGFTKEMFVTLVQEEKKLAGTDEKLADAHIFTKLDGRTEKKEEEREKAKPKERTKPLF